jgi:protein-disulfide isomerase
MTAVDPKQPNKPAPNRAAAYFAAPLLLIVGIGLLLLNRSHVEPQPSSTAAQLTAGGGTFTEDQKTAIQDMIREYLISHPEIVIEMQSALEQKMAKEEAEKTKGLVAEHGKDIYRHPNAAVAGNPDGDITVVEFFDYNCGYCKRGFSGVQKLIESDKNVRVVFKELPIIRDESEPVSRIALAARLQGRYWDMHRALITIKGIVNESEAFKVAEKLGLDIAKLKTDMNSPEVIAELERVKELAQKLGINGTPHFLVGDRAIGGAPENLYEVLEGHVMELRKTGCSYC